MDGTSSSKGAYMRIMLAVFALLAASYFGYLHGMNVGYVNATDSIGPPLYKCVELIGGKITHNGVDVNGN